MQIAYQYLNRSTGLRRSLGFTYIGLMLIVAIAGIALSGVGIVWKTEMQRENEKELRFAGEQYVAAIASYYECKVCGPHQLPKNLKDLLKDGRAPSVVHHLRKLYRDPMTRSNDWGLIKNGDRITGVYSKSKLEPLAKPYDLDLLNKKKNATQSGSTASVNQANSNPTNFNQVNANQAGISQTGGNNSGNSAIGTSVADINKTDNSKTAQPIKPKKPSYQDWQFVYGGGGDASAPTTVINQPNASQPASSNAPKNTTTNEPALDEWSTQRNERVTQVCDTSYQEDLSSCEQLMRGNQQAENPNQTEFKQCQADAKEKYNVCRKSVN